MLPPGRRKESSFVSLFHLLFLLLLSTSASAASAVLGIDLGTEYLKAALVKPGTPLEIVLTKDSKRKEAATVAFKPSRAQTTDAEAFPERLFGGDAVALAGRFPEDVYPNLKSLLGVLMGEPIVKEYSSRYPGLTLVAASRDGITKGNGTASFKSKTFGNAQEPFMVEELLAMEFQNLKANAEAGMPQGSLVTDAAVTFPAFYTAEEKRAVELAADLAGLRLLGLISDGLAVGLNYATGRTFDSVSEGARPEYHLVYDMGAGSTTATVLKFQGRTVKDGAKRNKTVQEVQVMGTGWDSTLGGDMLNQLVVDDMVAKFLERPRIKALGLERVHVKTHPKTMARFWKDAERIRQVLSANTQTSASFESLYYEDVSFSYKLSRTEFEALVGEHTGRVSAPLVKALDSAGVTLVELESIILHGGAVRTPFVQKQLEAVAGGSGKIKTNVNADEAAVMGAAFKAAGLSSSFRVKEIRAVDTPGFTISLKWTADGKERLQKIFTPTSQVGAAKQVPIKLLEDFKLQFTQASGELDVPIAEVDVTNLTASVGQLKDKYGCTATNITTTFTIRLSPVDGLPEVSSGFVSCEAEGLKEGDFMDNVKGLFGFGSKKAADQESLNADLEDSSLENDTTMTPLPLDDPTSSGSTVSSTSPSSTTSTKPAGKVTSPALTTISIPLAFTTTILGHNKPPTLQLPRIRARLAAFAASDRASALRSEALNNLEGFTYRARDYLSDSSFITASSDKVRQQLDQRLNAASEWLYGEGVDAKLKDFQDKLMELKTIVEPVLARKEESNKRDEAVKGVKDQLEQMASMIKMVESSISRAAEEAASVASSSVSAGVESASSVVEPVAESVTGTNLDGDDLDDDPYSTSRTSSGEAKATASPDVAFTAPVYTTEDLIPLQKSYDSVKAWLDEKVALQEKLTPSDDPAVLVKDLELRAKQLQTEVTNLIMKNIQGMPGGRSGGKKAKYSSEKKSKTKKAKNGRASGKVTVESVVQDQSTSTASATRSVKDEL